MDTNEKLDLILKVVNDGFKDINERLSILSKQVNNEKLNLDVEYLKQDISSLEQSVVDIKRRLRS